MSGLIEISPNSWIVPEHVMAVTGADIPTVTLLDGSQLYARNYQGQLVRLKTDIETAKNGHTVVVHNTMNPTDQRLE